MIFGTATLVDSLGTAATSMAGDVATVMIGALAIFTAIYGGRLVLKAFKIMK